MAFKPLPVLHGFRYYFVTVSISFVLHFVAPTGHAVSTGPTLDHPHGLTSIKCFHHPCNGNYATIFRPDK